MAHMESQDRGGHKAQEYTVSSQASRSRLEPCNNDDLMQLLREAAKHRASARNPFVCIYYFVFAVPGLQPRNQRSSGKKEI